MVARDLHLFSKLSELVTSKICSLVPKTHSLHPCPQTIVENKAYNLLSGVIKLKTPKIGSVAHQKNNHLWEVDFSKYERSSSYWDLKIFFPKCYKNIFSIVLAWPYREGKIKFPALSHKSRYKPKAIEYGFNKGMCTVHWAMNWDQLVKVSLYNTKQNGRLY